MLLHSPTLSMMMWRFSKAFSRGNRRKNILRPDPENHPSDPTLLLLRLRKLRQSRRTVLKRLSNMSFRQHPAIILWPDIEKRFDDDYGSFGSSGRPDEQCCSESEIVFPATLSAYICRDSVKRLSRDRALRRFLAMMILG